MPAGTYRVLDGDGEGVGEEAFRCAPGPAGWRYASTITTTAPFPHEESVDLVVDAAWRPVRLRVDTGDHLLTLHRTEAVLTGDLNGRAIGIPFGDSSELDYLTPCCNAVTANRLGRTAEIRAVFLEPVTCVPRVEPQRYELLGREEVETPVGRFEADRWMFTMLRTGWSRTMWVAGDVVVAYEDLYELVEYDPGATGPVPLS